MLTPEEAFFFAGKPREAELYGLLMEWLEQELLPFEWRVQKTQITLTNPKVFACVSLKWKDCIVLTFGLPDRVASDRIHQAAEIREGRWSHHVKIRDAEALDDEVLGWLKAAYLFAAR